MERVQFVNFIVNVNLLMTSLCSNDVVKKKEGSESEDNESLVVTVYFEFVN